jgi:hypothetical protein
MATWTKQALLSDDSATAEAAWANLCRYPHSLYLLASNDSVEVMNKGLHWTGVSQGYTSSSAMQVLRTCTGKVVVSQDMAYYRVIFLYAFALCFEMNWESSFPALNSEQSDTAFLLQDYIVEHPDNHQEEEVEELHWDKLKLPLSSLLALAYKRAETPMSYEVRKELLLKLPLIEEIPEHAKDNNFKNDSTRETDKVHKAWEKSSGEVLRVLACLDAKLNSDGQGIAADIEGTKKDLMTTAFYLLSDLQHRIQDYRRTASVPGSVVKDKDNLLFTKEEVATAKLQKSIDSMRSKGNYSKGGRGNQSRFRGNSNAYSAPSSSGGESGFQQSGYSNQPKGKGGRKGGPGRGGRGRKG